MSYTGWKICNTVRKIFLYSFYSQSFYCVWDRRRHGDQDRLLHWPITSSLDHSTLCYFQYPHLALLLLGRGYSTGGRCSLRSALRGCKLALTQTLIDSLTITDRHLHISYFIVPTTSDSSYDLLPLIYTGASLINGKVKGQLDTLVHPIFQNVYMWTFSPHPNASLSTPTSYKMWSRTTTANVLNHYTS